MTCILIELVFLVELKGNVHGPRSGPGAWVLNCGIIAQFIWGSTREAFNNLQLIRQERKVQSVHTDVVYKIGCFHNESIPLPMAPSVTHVGTKIRSHMRTPIQRDYSRLVHHFVANDNVARCLEDLVPFVVRIPGDHRADQSSGYAAAPQIEVLPRIGPFLDACQARWAESIPHLAISFGRLGRHGRQSPVLGINY